MTKAQACKLVEFIGRHYDSVSQEEYFDLCDMIFETVVHDANQQGYAAALAKKYPHFFSAKEA